MGKDVGLMAILYRGLCLATEDTKLMRFRSDLNIEIVDARLKVSE